MSKARYCVFIGRFQPLHRAHLKIIETALKDEAERLILVVGSYREPRSLRNPWTFEERKAQIEACLTPDQLQRTTIVPVRDYLYSQITWLTGVQNAISAVTGHEKSIKIIGHFKEDSSYYLKMFPQWTLVQQPNSFGASSGAIRNSLFGIGSVKDVMLYVPDQLVPLLDEYKKTKAFDELSAEWDFIQKYKERWTSSPFPPVFVTTDAVVVQSGHVLVVTRKMNPGKGKFALPGGFLQQNQSLLDSCLRELKEETEIRFPRDELKLCLKGNRVFDHPHRDPRGRTITHAFYFQIDQLGPLPEVEGGDDAAAASWLPLSDLSLHEENFYSDHLHIINHFIRR